MSTTQDYAEAMGRNIGLLTAVEQERLRGACVALPGLGGVGGGHLQALARLGIGAFHLADPDHFERANFNRQLGATTASLGRSKVEVSAELVRSIHPDVRLRLFPDGINPQNIDDFLDGVDVVVDGIEFFAIETRRMLYAACRRRRIPIVTAGPIGYGATLYVFMPDGVSFDAHFGIDDGMTRAEMLLAHALGHATGLRSDLDPASVDFEREKGPALASACFLCSGMAAMEVVKLVCGRGAVAAAPHGIYFDPYRGRLLPMRRCPSVRRSLRGRIMRWFAFRRYPGLQALHERELQSRAALPTFARQSLASSEVAR